MGSLRVSGPLVNTGLDSKTDMSKLLQSSSSSQLDDSIPPGKRSLSLLAPFQWSYSSVRGTRFPGDVSPKPRIHSIAHKILESCVLTRGWSETICSSLLFPGESEKNSLIFQADGHRSVIAVGP